MGGGAESQLRRKGRKITLEELSKHREMDDAWVSMRGKVYDVSGWADHPGKCDAYLTLIWFCLFLLKSYNHWPVGMKFLIFRSADFFEHRCRFNDIYCLSF